MLVFAVVRIILFTFPVVFQGTIGIPGMPGFPGSPGLKVSFIFS